MLHKVGVFGALAHALGHEEDHKGWHYPRTKAEWLHMAEGVHMQLFIGMILYFLLMRVVTVGTVRKLQYWEHCTMNASLQDTLGNLPASEGSDTFAHNLWRRFFLVKMVRLQYRYPGMFDALIDELGMDASSHDFSSRFHAYLDKHFPFTTYITVNVERGVRDTIQVHWTSWALLLTALSILAIVHRYGRIAIMSVIPVIVFIVWMCMLTMRLIVRLTMRRFSELVDEAEDFRPRSSPNQHKRLRERHATDLIMLRVLQAVFFLISYSFSRTVMDFHDWAKRPLETLVYTALFSALFISLARNLPKSIPLFLGMMALPPSVDHSKFKVFCAVLLQARRDKRAQALTGLHQGIAKGTVHSPIREAFASEASQTTICIDDLPRQFVEVAREAGVSDDELRRIVQIRATDDRAPGAATPGADT